MSTHGALEAILLMATEPTASEELAAALELPVDEVERELDAIAAFYDDHERGIRLRRIAGGWRFATDTDLADVLEAWLVSDQRSRLTQAALETLSVIAYLQPVTRGRISGVRGVNVDGVVKTLLVRGLIAEAGEDPTTGAMTFATTPLFLQKLGLNSLKELPDLAPLLPDAVALEAELGELAAATVPEPPAEEEDDIERPEGIRLQKVLAAAGIASRRASEALIDEGRVSVNGKVVTEQGLRVDPETDHIRVDGSRIPPPRRHLYLVMNKPRGVVSTMEDPEGRTTLLDFLPRMKERVFHVGRLDTDTEGLILLTNDGEFAHRMAHPSYEVPKTYHVQAAGVMDNRTLKRLEKGVTLDDGPVKPDKVKLLSRAQSRTLVEISLHEGRNRIVRRMLDTVGHPVDRLARTAIGPVRLGTLPVGEVRELTREELGALLDLVGM